ncbi:hypothetical protein [Pediococcus ethanolidurans]
MSIAETESHRIDSVLSSKNSIARISSVMSAMYGPVVKDELNVDRSQITGGMPDSSDNLVRIGDLLIPLN